MEENTSTNFLQEIIEKDLADGVISAECELGPYAGDYKDEKNPNLEAAIARHGKLKDFLQEMEAAYRAVIAAFPDRDGVGYFECQAQMNRIFSMLYRCSDSYLTSHDMSLLGPAMDYIKENMFSPIWTKKKKAN